MCSRTICINQDICGVNVCFALIVVKETKQIGSTYVFFSFFFSFFQFLKKEAQPSAPPFSRCCLRKPDLLVNKLCPICCERLS